MSKIGSASALPDLDRNSIVPLYRQIYEALREAILAGTLPESTRLPPERTLAERLDVNRSTVVHAYRELVADGLIEQKVGFLPEPTLRVSKALRLQLLRIVTAKKIIDEQRVSNDDREHRKARPFHCRVRQKNHSGKTCSGDDRKDPLKR